MILEYALKTLLVVSFFTAMASMCLLLYCGIRLMGAFNDPGRPWYKRLVIFLFPAAVISPWAQPPERKVYFYRFAMSAVGLAGSIGTYELCKFYLATLN